MFNPGGEPVRRGCETFLRVVPTFDDLPQTIQQAIRQHQSTCSIRQVLFIPPQRYLQRRTIWGRKLTLGWRSTPPRTVVFGAEQITIVEGLEAQTTWCIPLADLLTIRLATVLLHSYFELEWHSSMQTQAMRVEFNSVERRWIERELLQVRSWIAAQSGLANTISSLEFSVRHFPFKFHSYTRTSLLPGEQVWTGVYEPAMRSRGRRLSATLSPNRVIVITGQHLMTISDQCPDSGVSRIKSYLIDRWFCPRARITGVAFEAQGDVVWLTLCLGDTDHEYLLPLREPHAAQLQMALTGWLLT
jgi:hypothetical protein